MRAYRGASETSEWSNTVSATTPIGSGTFNFPIVAANDDAVQFTSGGLNGYMWLDAPYTYFGFDVTNGENNDEGLRFQNITIPQGATINSAYIEFRAYGSGSGDTTVTFRTEDIDDAPPFASSANNLTSRNFGSASVDWTLGTWSSGSYYQSPDLTSIIQPVINRTGWFGGNSLVFVSQGTQTGTHRAYSFDNFGGTSIYRPELVIDYTWTPPGNQAPTAAFTFDCADLECTFTDTSTDADGAIASWSWDFGDSGTSTAQNPIHTYAAYGNYNVSLTVTDDDGDPDTVVVPVTVQQVHRGPYLQTLTDTSVIVRWRTALATDSVVRYGLTDSLSLIHISEPTRQYCQSRMPSSA